MCKQVLYSQAMNSASLPLIRNANHSTINHQWTKKKKKKKKKNENVQMAMSQLLIVFKKQS